MQRRHLLQASLLGAASAGLCTSTRLLAAPAGTPRFLLVFLRGGYDALSLLVPTSAYYREVRPNIAIVEKAADKAGDKPGTGAAPGALNLDADWGLHPALAQSVMPLVALGQARFVPFAGTDDLTRSHFETQDSIELGQALTGRRDFGSGFLNRLAGVLQGSGQPGGHDAIAFTDQLPLVMRGELSVANLSLKVEPRAGDEKLRAALAGMYRDHPLQSRIAESFEVRQEAVKDIGAWSATTAASSPPAAGLGAMGMAGEQVSANRGALSAKGFELEARRIARLMRERYALGFVDVGGWDTHVGQGNGEGYLASRLEELGRGVAAYADELGPAAWRHTVVVVLSEFGRTVRENGNRGTDHGHGSVHWVLGGGLGGGAAVVGEQLPVEARRLFQNRDLPVLNEYRAVLGGVLVRQFALSPAQLDQVFPGAPPKDLGLV
jgi:uncharacterized protein (DUF1501 family)